MTTNRSKISRLNKTTTGFRDLHVNTPQRNKLVIIRKIIMISSIKKEVKKILHKIIDLGIAYFCEEQSKVLLEEAKTILDNDKQKELGKDLDKILSNKDETIQVSQQILKLIKYFVISPTEKSYITKIEKELKQDEDLDYQIKQIEEQINEQKNNKLRVYELQKTGKVLGMSTKVINRKKEIDNFQNKLMRSNQKLNELYANNNKLRDKISQLRKQKNAIIYNKLKKQLDIKNENVQNTIRYANQANKARVKAEKDLKNLKQEAQSKKQQFKQECFKLNNQIQHDIRFKQFIKSKQIEKQQLDKLEEQIKINQKTIEAKKQSNEKIDHEYRKSINKEQQIKKAFDNIKKEIGIGNVGPQNQGKQLLNVFINLYQKNTIMNTFVQQLTKQVQQLENKIIRKRKQIQEMYLRGSADQLEKDKLNEQLKKKVQYQKRKKQILDNQYEKSVQTLTIIKKYLEQIFQQINIDPQVIQKLKNCNINEDNLTQFLGQLQKKGLQAISHYGKLVGQQLKGQKGNSWQIQKQIDELDNIITLENVNTMNNPGPAKIADYPSQLLVKVKDQKIKEQDNQKPFTLQQFKKFAIESLQHFQKKGGCPRQQQRNNKYTVSHQNSLKIKKKNKQNVQAK